MKRFTKQITVATRGKHTSASLAIQENADPDVMADLNEFFGRLSRVLLVEQPHQPEILLGLALRLVVQTRPAQIQVFALPPNADFASLAIDKPAKRLSRVRRLFF